MTFASKITITRLLMAPVFAVLAIYYAQSISQHHANEALRMAALMVFVTACVSDGIDGYIARHFNQRSAFGAFIDPLADKTLLLTGITTLSLVDWGAAGWRLPLWFTALVYVRDAVILGGIVILHYANGSVPIRPHWTGKVCTFSQMFALGWVMLRWVKFDPFYPCSLAGFFTILSGIVYFRQGLVLLKKSELHRVDRK